GSVAVRVQIVEPTDRIVCNAVDIAIDDAWLEAGGRRTELRVEPDEEHERVALVSPAAIDTGEATLHLAFRGELNDKLRGFYRSRFRADDGTEHVLATTQFEATDARRAFPCWDEPEYKAVFAVTLVVPEHLQAVSNCAPVEDGPTGDGRRRIRFADTMVMSTYLVAFIVGPLE